VSRAPRQRTPEQRLLDATGNTRIMSWVMAIMLFLTVLAGALGLAAARAAASLDRSLAGKLTVQLVEPDTAKRDALAARVEAGLRALPLVRLVAPVDRARLAAMLRPWLGEDGTDADLPVPALIDVTLATPTDAAVARVTGAVRAVAPAARIDRQARWMSPVAGLMRIAIGGAAVLVALLAAATGAVVVLTARAGLETHRDTIQILHMLGSTDVQVARLFQRRIALDTLTGGLMGTMLALAAILFVGGQAALLDSELIGGAMLSGRDWLILAAFPLTFAVLALIVARLAVTRTLRAVL